MRQVLLLEDNLELSKIIKLNLMKAYDLEVIEKVNYEEGVELIEILPTIECVIIREPTKNHESIFSQLIDKLNEKEKKISLLIVGHKNYQYSAEYHVDPNSSWKVIIDIVGKILKLSPDIDYRDSLKEFIPIPIAYFYNITETSIGCDVYIRVKKSEGEYQYIKRLNSTDSFERADIERYGKSGLKDFFISKEHFPHFVNYVTDSVTLKLANPDLVDSERVKLTSEVYEITVDRIQTLGVDERTIEMVEESVKSMKTTLGKDNALTDYLALLSSNKMSYGYSHSYLTSLLLFKIVKGFEWDSHLVRDKITYISYFHDMSLPNDELMKIESQASLDASDLSKADRDLVLHHAIKSAEIVEKFPQVPLGLGPLIREHHGVKSGLGFRASLSIGLSPLSMMFVVVEDFVHQFLAIKENPSRDQIQQIFNNMELIYTKTTYAQTLLALQNNILKK